MGGLSDLLNRRSFRRSQQYRVCPDCDGRGTWTRPARAPDGTIPSTRVVLRIKCSTCKGRGEVLVGDEVHEDGRVKIYGPDGGLVVDAPDVLPPR